MKPMKAIAHTYPEDEYIEELIVTLPDTAPATLRPEDIAIEHFDIEGPQARFDPALGKNVVEVVTSTVPHPVTVRDVRVQDGAATISCGRIPTRVRFNVAMPGARFTQEDVEAIENAECARFSRHHVDAHGVAFNYRLFTPQPSDDTPEEGYPLVLALHGSGETADKCDGDNNLHIAVSRLALAFATDAWQAEHPCYVLAPQFPSLEESYETAAYEDAYLEVIDELIATGAVDANRVYTATLSMGSRIVYSLLCHYPDRFAAALINAGNPAENDMSLLQTLPVTVTHVEHDPAVMTRFGKAVFQRLTAEGNRAARLQLYPVEDVEREHLLNAHQSWALAMEDRTMLSWLFAQRRGRACAASAPVVELDAGLVPGELYDDAVYVDAEALAICSGWDIVRQGDTVTLGCRNRSVAVDGTTGEVTAAGIAVENDLPAVPLGRVEGSRVLVRCDVPSLAMGLRARIQFL